MAKILGAITWVLLAFFVLGETFVLLGITLTLVILHGAPSTEAAILAGVAVAVAVALCWLVARFFASWQIVRRVVAILVAIMLIPATIWAVASPDDATYLARTVAWGESDVLDYQKFPSRVVQNAPPVFNFAERPAPELFQSISYISGGEEKQASLDGLLKSSDTTSFLVIKDDVILYQGYFNGYQRDSIVTSFSMAKSVTSALIGIAIDEGYIGSVNDPMITYLPEMKGRGFDQMTIRDLLLMSTGIRYSSQDDAGLFSTEFPYTALNPYADDTASYEYTDLRKLALDLPASRQPVGAAFKYNPYHPILLGMILERTTGRSVSAYSQEKLWQPLGMESPATWSLDSTKHGFEKMESGLNGRAIDFAKFGGLFLHNGTWNGRQLISTTWVTSSTAPDPSDTRPWLSDEFWKNAGGYYKYQWWGFPLQTGGYAYAAHGHLGQMIAVFPQDHLIVVRFGIADGGVDSWDQVALGIAAKVRTP